MGDVDQQQNQESNAFVTVKMHKSRAPTIDRMEGIDECVAISTVVPQFDDGYDADGYFIDAPDEQPEEIAKLKRSKHRVRSLSTLSNLEFVPKLKSHHRSLSTMSSIQGVDNNHKMDFLFNMMQSQGFYANVIEM